MRDLLFSFGSGDEDEDADEAMQEGMKEVIAYNRRWGTAGLAFLASHVVGSSIEVDMGSSSSWIYSNLDKALMARGPPVRLPSFGHRGTEAGSTRYDPLFLLPFLSDLLVNTKVDLRKLVCDA